MQHCWPTGLFTADSAAHVISAVSVDLSIIIIIIIIIIKQEND